MSPPALVTIRRDSRPSNLPAGLHSAHQQIFKVQQRVLLSGVHLLAEASPGNLPAPICCGHGISILMPADSQLLLDEGCSFSPIARTNDPLPCTG